MSTSELVFVKYIYSTSQKRTHIDGNMQMCRIVSDSSNKHIMFVVVIHIVQLGMQYTNC